MSVALSMLKYSSITLLTLLLKYAHCVWLYSRHTCKSWFFEFYCNLHSVVRLLVLCSRCTTIVVK